MYRVRVGGRGDAGNKEDLPSTTSGHLRRLLYEVVCTSFHVHTRTRDVALGNFRTSGPGTLPLSTLPYLTLPFTLPRPLHFWKLK
jgi:hypothetical protein